MPARTPAQSDAAPPALAATTNVREVAAMRHVLGPLGGTLHACVDAGDVLRLCTELAPAVVVLDAGLHGLDLPKVTRILARNPITAVAAVLVVAPPDAGERDLRRLRGLELFALLARPLTCDALRENLAAGLKFHADALALRRPQRRGAVALAEGCNSLLVRTLHCPFHPHGVPVRHFALRGGKVYARTDVFDLPHYTQAAPGADFVDYAKAMLCVCPECFFATTEPRFLHDPQRPTGEEDAYFEIDAATAATVAAGAGRRELLCHDRLGEPAASLFDHKRSAAEALAGYELAVESGRALVEAAPARRAGERVRVAGYELRRASIYEADRNDPAAALACRRSAVRWLDEAVQTARGPALYVAAYQLVAQCVHLGDDAAAVRYLTSMKHLAGQGRRAGDDPALLERYHRRARAVWEGRDNHRAAA